MKEYMFLFRSLPEEMLKLSEEQSKEYFANWSKWINKFVEDGSYLYADRLNHTEAKTISGEKNIITDGPYAESKEIIGGFIRIKAENMDEALELAKGCPIYDVNGSLEIRTNNDDCV